MYIIYLLRSHPGGIIPQIFRHINMLISNRAGLFPPRAAGRILKQLDFESLGYLRLVNYNYKSLSMTYFNYLLSLLLFVWYSEFWGYSAWSYFIPLRNLPRFRVTKLLLFVASMMSSHVTYRISRLSAMSLIAMPGAQLNFLYSKKFVS